MCSVVVLYIDHDFYIDIFHYGGSGSNNLQFLYYMG